MCGKDQLQTLRAQCVGQAVHLVPDEQEVASWRPVWRKVRGEREKGAAAEGPRRRWVRDPTPLDGGRGGMELLQERWRGHTSQPWGCTNAGST